jgi:hypothetical protein
VKSSPVWLFGSVVPLSLGAALLLTWANAFGQVNVTQYHNDAARDGLYVDPAFTTNAAANLERDTNFNGAISGEVFMRSRFTSKAARAAGR